MMSATSSLCISTLIPLFIPSYKATSEAISYTLPEAVMHHIFSLLPLKVLILASLVSKQWESLVIKYVSMIPSSLNLDELEMADRVICKNAEIIQTQCIEWPCLYQLCLRYSISTANRYFTGFVNRTLYLHTGCIINKLCFSFCYDGLRTSQERIDQWFLFAITNEVRELELNFSEGKSVGYEKLTRLYELPHGQLAPQSLERIILKFCKLGSSSLGSFISLKSLFLKDVKVFDFSVEELASKCCKLEDLSLECCTLPWNFMVSKAGIMIRRLSIISCRTEVWPMCHIDISAPELLMLTLEESYLMKPFNCLQNCLKEVSIFGVSARSSEIQMLRFFLENAKVLNNMSICVTQEMFGQDISQQLSNYQKGSPRATISICRH